MNIFVFFYIADILPMFADIFADKSDNIFLDPRRYIRRHDICNIGISDYSYPLKHCCALGETIILPSGIKFDHLANY